MNKHHSYKTTLIWTGNKGTGTDHYKNYERSHMVKVNNKPTLECSSDPSFRGDPTKHNPEELLVASLSSCHMLWYLHLCSAAGVVVETYEDTATATMEETPDGGGHFTEVTLHPQVKVKEAHMIEKAKELHHKANQLCFIANSVNFPVKHEVSVFI